MVALLHLNRPITSVMLASDLGTQVGTQQNPAKALLDKASGGMPPQASAQSTVLQQKNRHENR
jgi:hypothetical protein